MSSEYKSWCDICEEPSEDDYQVHYEKYHGDLG